MEKLHIRLENEQLQPQLDWIIDRASETNFDYPAVSCFFCIIAANSQSKLFSFNLGILDLY